MNVSVDLARELLDMGARLRRSGDDDAHSSQADEQLCGAVAMHNILQREGVAYLADEVGMGKTYVALGAIALFRHFNPQFRVAVIAPRENIQAKWMKEWLNFATYIARVPDLRVQALHGGPARPLARCDNLQQFIRETTVNPHRDFFLRLSSFSLGTGDAEEDVRALRSRFQRELPWLEDAVTSLRKREFKDNPTFWQPSIPSAVSLTFAPPCPTSSVSRGRELCHNAPRRANPWRYRICLCRTISSPTFVDGGR